jgi:S1-C subfamily serine protease
MVRQTGNIKLISALAIGVLIGVTFKNLDVNDYSEFRRDLQKEEVKQTGTWLKNKRVNVFKKVSPSVVFIDVFEKDKQTQSRDIPKGSGSGFIWDSNGHIITNNHVVAGASFVEVSLLTKKKDNDVDDTNGKMYLTSHFGRNSSVQGYHWKVLKADVIGTDPVTDTAVIKVDTSGVDLHPIELGDAKAMEVGQDVLAIGNPYGLDHTLTQGIISAKNRVQESSVGILIRGVLQTDAAINPGNSGGPLLDLSGRVIGMNTAILSGSGSSAGIGFAVPSGIINWASKLLIKNGKIHRPYTGIAFDEHLQALLGIKKGILIRGIFKESPAAKLGLKSTSIEEDGSIQIGDIIIGVNGAEVDSDLDFFEIIEDHKPGQNIELELLRFAEESKQGLETKVVQAQLILGDSSAQIATSRKLVNNFRNYY